MIQIFFVEVESIKDKKVNFIGDTIYDEKLIMYLESSIINWDLPPIYDECLENVENPASKIVCGKDNKINDKDYRILLEEDIKMDSIMDPYKRI